MQATKSTLATRGPHERGKALSTINLTVFSIAKLNGRCGKESSELQNVEPKINRATMETNLSAAPAELHLNYNAWQHLERRDVAYQEFQV